MHAFLRYAIEKQEEIIALIGRMVECESPSDEPAAVNRMTDLLIEATADIAIPKVIALKDHGHHLRLEFQLPGVSRNRQILALGHADTVWPLGTLVNMPFRRAEGRLWGPGVLDMKAGLAFWIYAMRALRELDVEVSRRAVLLVVSDEEIGSPYSRPITEAEARKSEIVLVLEPGTGLTGKLKTARKGVGRYVLTVTGKAAHAGVDFEAGASAIVELARQVDRIAMLTDLLCGVTVNPGVIRGGTKSNVVAASAHVEIDVRIPEVALAEKVDGALRSLRPFDSRCSLNIEGGLNRPPMERTPRISELYARAQAIAEKMGLRLEESATGGGSDGNFTAALGIPTLDGLGAVGEGAHAETESIRIDRIADRTALLAGLAAGL